MQHFYMCLSTLSNIHTLTPMDSVSSGLLGVQKIIANLKSTVAAGTMTYYGVWFSFLIIQKAVAICRVKYQQKTKQIYYSTWSLYIFFKGFHPVLFLEVTGIYHNPQVQSRAEKHTFAWCNLWLVLMAVLLMHICFPPVEMMVNYTGPNIFHMWRRCTSTAQKDCHADCTWEKYKQENTNYYLT